MENGSTCGSGLTGPETGDGSAESPDGSGRGSGAPPDARAVRRARAWLSRAVEPGPLAVHDFLTEHGPVEAVRRIRAGRAPDQVLGRVGERAARDRVEEDLAVARRGGIRFVTPEDDEWPAGPLLAMEIASARRVCDVAPPQALWVRGPVRLCDAVDRAVAVVGARAAT
ncbi:MAG TPA: hypothetical protein VFX70_19110, partial [Mycobacteriales bacterium]|nr:hypothetical protein [Mycobacteriales bacterium]